jgi:hypothetical protein
MIIFIVEVALILVLVLIYLRRELEISIRDFRHGDIIWVRDQSLKPQRAVLSKWNNATFCYMLDGSYDLKFKKWYFLAYNESYAMRENVGNSLLDKLNIKLPKLKSLTHQTDNIKA